MKYLAGPVSYSFLCMQATDMATSFFLLRHIAVAASTTVRNGCTNSLQSHSYVIDRGTGLMLGNLCSLSIMLYIEGVI